MPAGNGDPHSPAHARGLIRDRYRLATKDHRFALADEVNAASRSDRLAFLVAVARVGRSEHLLRSRRVPAPRPFFKIVPYLDFSLIPSIIAFICGCRSPIICIIADIERCITSGIF